MGYCVLLGLQNRFWVTVRVTLENSLMSIPFAAALISWKVGEPETTVCFAYVSNSLRRDKPVFRVLFVNRRGLTLREYR